MGVMRLAGLLRRGLAGGVAACAVAASAEPLWQPAQLWHAQETLLPSRHTGKTYRIQTLAVGDAPRQGYPVLYILDGDLFFPMAASLAQGFGINAAANRAAPLLLVGVGYAGGLLINKQARAGDYVPAQDGQGGAAAFRRFLIDELKPLLSGRYAVNASRQSLFGHSYGGLFALHTLLKSPQDFQDYLIASPSLWQQDRRVLQDLPAFLATELRTPVYVRLSVGEYEQTPAPNGQVPPGRLALMAERKMVDNLRELAEQLSRMQGARLSLHSVEYPQTGHIAAGFAALADALPFVYTRCRETPDCAPQAVQP